MSAELELVCLHCRYGRHRNHRPAEAAERASESTFLQPKCCCSHVELHGKCASAKGQTDGRTYASDLSMVDKCRRAPVELMQLAGGETVANSSSHLSDTVTLIRAVLGHLSVCRHHLLERLNDDRYDRCPTEIAKLKTSAIFLSSN